MRNVLIEFERIVIPDDEGIPENSTQHSTESADNKLTNPTTNTAAPTTLHEKPDEMDDFDFLGDDDNVMRYLNSQKKDPEIPELSCTTHPQEEDMGSKNEEEEGEEGTEGEETDRGEEGGEMEGGEDTWAAVRTSTGGCSLSGEVDVLIPSERRLLALTTAASEACEAEGEVRK